MSIFHKEVLDSSQAEISSLTSDGSLEMDHNEVQSIKQKSIHGAISFLMRTILIQGIGFVAAAIISAYLSPEDFGVYGFVLQMIGLLTFFADVGLAAALVQKKDEPSLVEYRTAFTIQQILSWFIVVVIVFIVLSGVVQAKIGSAGVWLLLSLGVSFPITSLKTISAIKLERKLEFSKLALPQIFEQLVFQGVLIALALTGAGVISYAYAVIARSITGVGMMWFLQPWSVGVYLDKKAFKTLFGFGAKFQANDLLARMKDQFFTLVVASFMTQREFGFVQWAKNWSMYPYNLTVQNVMAITFPTFARLQHHPQLLKKAIEKSLFFITVVIFPILAGMCLIIWPVTQIITKYNKWEPAVLSFIFFTLSIIGAAVSTPLTNTLNALGKINQTLALMVLWTVMTWVITPILFFKYGFNGVAFANILISLTSFLPIWMVKKIVDFDFFDQVWRQGVATIVMSFVGVLGMTYWAQSVKNLLIGIALMAVVYIVSLMFVGWVKVKQELISLRTR